MANATIGKRLTLCGASTAAIMLFTAAPAWAQTSNAPDQNSAAAAAGAPSPATPSSATDDAQTSPDIVVTGTSIRGVPPTGSNLISLTSADIQTIGASTTADLLATIPQLNSFNTAPRASAGGFASFAPGLRGLPSSETLLLMNGHRLVGASAQETNPDYPNIPDLAIERVEVVADGASAIYGSDAVAGVVNFITRKKASGLEANVRYGIADNYHNFSVSALDGRDWGSGSVLLAYQYTENSNITAGDRHYRVEDFRPYGGVDTRSTNCPLPNVTITGAVNYAAPALAPNTTNYCDANASTDLLPQSRVHSAFLTAHQDLGDRATLWADVLYSDRLDRIQTAPPTETLLILNSNPFFRAPPGTGAPYEYVLFRADNLFGADHLEETDRTRIGNSSAGVDVHLPRHLNLSVYGTFDWARNDAFIPGIDTAALTAAEYGTTAATALDPFGTGTAPAVAAAITDAPTDVTIHQRTYLGAVKLDGPLFDLPGGELRFATGAEYRRETFRQRGSVGPTAVPEDLGRNIYSVYGELFVPIFGAGNETPLFHRLDLSLSGRYDHYSDFGSTSNPKIGVDWAPVDGVTFRGTYGRSFRAPGMRQIGATVGAYYLPASYAAAGAYDPTRGAAQVDTVYLLGGNPDLQPEKARTYSFGVDLTPRFLSGFRANLTYYNLHFTNAIETPTATLVFSDPTLASNIIREPSAAQLADFLTGAVPVNLPGDLSSVRNLLDLRVGNYGIRDTDGLDFNVGYQRPTHFGSVFATVTGNYILNYDMQASAQSAVSNSLRLGLPRLTFRAGAGGSVGPVSFAAFANYTGSITNAFATPTGTSQFTSDSYTTVDLRVAVKLPNTGLASGTELSLQVNDLFDQRPPFFPATNGLTGVYNPIGRFVAFNLRKAF